MLVVHATRAGEMLRPSPGRSSGALDEAALDRLAGYGREATVKQDQVLCGEGHVGHEFFAISEGAAVVSVDGDTVARLGPGDFFGEGALLAGAPRNATVTAIQPTTVMIVYPPEFDRLLDDEPDLAVRILGAHARRAVAAPPLASLPTRLTRW